MRPQPLIAVIDVEASSRCYQHLLGCHSAHDGTDRYAPWDPASLQLWCLVDGHNTRCLFYPAGDVGSTAQVLSVHAALARVGVLMLAVGIAEDVRSYPEKLSGRHAGDDSGGIQPV